MKYFQKILTAEDILHKLMPFRINEILLVSSVYDAFILEQDFQLIEQMYSNFQEFQLTCIPRITKIPSFHAMENMIEQRSFDLVVLMGNIYDASSFGIIKYLKENRPNWPVVLLLDSINMVYAAMENRNLADGIFFWTGDTILFSTIVRYIEDRMNIAHDISTGVVKVILVYDDDVASYSQFLPVMYQEVLRQTQHLIQEDLDEISKLLRRQTRPKILLATSVEECQNLYSRYKTDVMGIICQIFSKDDFDNAGLKFIKDIQANNLDLPVIVIADQSQRELIGKLSQVYKNSPTLRNDLRNFMNHNMGFGDFVFRLPDGTSVARAKNIKEFQSLLQHIPEESILYHASRNHISLWFLARGEYGLALEFHPRDIREFGDAKVLRDYIIETIATYRDQKQIGIVARYRPGDWDSDFIQIGQGSLGGKGRGLAFIHHLLACQDFAEKFPQIQIRIPKTVVIATEIFDQFLELNNLRDVYTLQDDKAICDRFIIAKLPANLSPILREFLEQSHMPLAVRSSSMLEDSQYFPFAGIYSTFMIPNMHPDLEVRLSQLLQAIKLVYASVFFQGSRVYMESTSYKLEQEKMAIVLQEIAGQKKDDLFYPTFSGVSQTYNFYPVAPLEASDGIVQIAVGLGKSVIGGSNCVRFCPRYPDNITQFATVRDTLRNSQSYLYALNLKNPSANFTDEDATLERIECFSAPFDVMRNVSSIYNYEEDRIIEDMTTESGFRIVTFAPILRQKIIPLDSILDMLQTSLRKAMGKEIEMEFAGNIFPSHSKKKPILYILQVRPIIVNHQDVTISHEEQKPEKLICLCSKVLGYGLKTTRDIVYVSPKRFDRTKTKNMADEIGRINQSLRKEGRQYLLLGVGRWGTSDPCLGIPVEWEQISNVLAMVELGMSKDFYADVSSGSHFFQNVTALSIGYFLMSGRSGLPDFVDWEFLEKYPSQTGYEFVRHIHLEKEIIIKIDGKIQRGIILKPIA